MTYFPEPAWSNIVSYLVDHPQKTHAKIWPYIKVFRYKSLNCVKYKVYVRDCPSIYLDYQKVHTSLPYTPEWKYSYCNYADCCHCGRNIFQGTFGYEDGLCEDCATLLYDDEILF